MEYTYPEDAVRFFDIAPSVKVCAVSIPSMFSSAVAALEMNAPAADISLFIPMASYWGIALTERFSSFRTFKRQSEWIAGRAAFAMLSRKYSGVQGRIITEQSGAPAIEGSSSAVSITHAGDYAAAAICLEKDMLLGIDMERIRSFPHRMSFLKVGFPEEDISEMSVLPDDDILRMWTLKESFLKIIKKGFSENLGQVRILPDAFVYREKTIKELMRKSISFDGHMLSVVYGNASFPITEKETAL